MEEESPTMPQSYRPETNDDTIWWQWGGVETRPEMLNDPIIGHLLNDPPPRIEAATVVLETGVIIVGFAFEEYPNTVFQVQIVVNQGLYLKQIEVHDGAFVIQRSLNGIKEEVDEKEVKDFIRYTIDPLLEQAGIFERARLLLAQNS